MHFIPPNTVFPTDLNNSEIIKLFQSTESRAEHHWCGSTFVCVYHNPKKSSSLLSYSNKKTKHIQLSVSSVVLFLVQNLPHRACSTNSLAKLCVLRCSRIYRGKIQPKRSALKFLPPSLRAEQITQVHNEHRKLPRPSLTVLFLFSYKARAILLFENAKDCLPLEISYWFLYPEL